MPGPVGVPSKKDNSWSVMSTATSQMCGASWKPRVKLYPWANVTGRTHNIIKQCQQMLCRLGHKFRNKLHTSIQLSK